MSGNGRPGAWGRPRRWRGSANGLRAVLGLAAVGVTGASDAEPLHDAIPCSVGGVAVQLFVGSRLFEAPGDRLELLAGRALDCRGAAARPVLAAIADGLESLPPGSFGPPVRVHLQPRLPAGQAPLAGVEVHVTSRELLVGRSALEALAEPERLAGPDGLAPDEMAALGPEVWRHELLHVTAAPPPEGPIEARRLWLTLEEGLVSFVAGAPQEPEGGLKTASGEAGDVARNSSGGERDEAPPRRSSDAVPAEATTRDALPSALGSRRVLPFDALLASPAYDPHPLAAGLARELERGAARVPLDEWLSCLSARPLALPLGAVASDVFRAFVGRCPPPAARAVRAAIARWWGDARAESAPAESAPAEEPARRKATARAEESR